MTAPLAAAVWSPGELAELGVPGRRFDGICGDEDGFTPFTPVWTKGGGGRFTFGGWEAGLEIAVAIL